jgi:hypothetical protein
MSGAMFRRRYRYHPRVTQMRLLEGHCVHLVFSDGAEGVADLSDLVGSGPVFMPLTDPEFFRKVRLNHESGTIEWPNGADVAPETLYDWVREQTPAG